jgi:uncharacterized protein YggE
VAQRRASRIESYEVINRIQLRVLEVKSLGSILDQLVSLGANKVDNIEFDVAEKEEIYKELLEEATAAAKDKAQRMAKAAGLGKITVLELREEVGGSEHSQPRYGMEMASAKMSDISIPLSGSTVLKASVALVAKAWE